MKEATSSEPLDEALSLHSPSHQHWQLAFNRSALPDVIMTLAFIAQLQITYPKTRSSRTLQKGHENSLHVIWWEEPLQRLQVPDELSTETVALPRTQTIPNSPSLLRVRY